MRNKAKQVQKKKREIHGQLSRNENKCSTPAMLKKFKKLARLKQRERQS